jgi:hypothetical protein
MPPNFGLTAAGKLYDDVGENRDQPATSDVRFHATSATFDKNFANEGETLAIQLSIRK